MNDSLTITFLGFKVNSCKIYESFGLLLLYAIIDDNKNLNNYDLEPRELEELSISVVCMYLQSRAMLIIWEEI